MDAAAVVEGRPSRASHQHQRNRPSADIEPTALRSPVRSIAATALPGRLAVRVYFARKDRLVTVLREAPSASATDGLHTVLEALHAGPNSTEQARGLASALPEDLQLTIGEVQGMHVTLELSDSIGDRCATENILAVGQIVLSVTARLRPGQTPRGLPRAARSAANARWKSSRTTCS